MEKLVIAKLVIMALAVVFVIASLKIIENKIE